MRFRNIVLIYPVKVVICPVVVNVITAKIAVFIYIPCGVVIIGIEAVANVSAFDFFISHASAVPQSEIGNNKNGLRKLNVEVHTLIAKIIRIGFTHDFIEFIVRIAGIFFF